MKVCWDIIGLLDASKSLDTAVGEIEAAETRQAPLRLSHTVFDSPLPYLVSGRLGPLLAVGKRFLGGSEELASLLALDTHWEVLYLDQVRKYLRLSGNSGDASLVGAAQMSLAAFTARKSTAEEDFQPLPQVLLDSSLL